MSGGGRDCRKCLYDFNSLADTIINHWHVKRVFWVHPSSWWCVSLKYASKSLLTTKSLHQCLHPESESLHPKYNIYFQSYCHTSLTYAISTHFLSYHSITVIVGQWALNLLASTVLLICKYENLWCEYVLIANWIVGWPFVVVSFTFLNPTADVSNTIGWGIGIG